MSARLQAFLLREGVIGEMALQGAVERQRIYGGGLDTAILERGLMTEPAIWARLSAVTGLPVPAPSLCSFEGGGGAPPELDPDVTRGLRAVPVGRQGDSLDILCAEPVAARDIREAAAARGFSARLFVVPETRLLALRRQVYGEPLPSRYAPLLARALGPSLARGKKSGGSQAGLDGAATAARQAVAPRGLTELEAPTPLERFFDLSGALAIEPPKESDVEVESVPDGSPAGDHEVKDPAGDPATEALCRRARDAEDKGRILALRALRQRMTHPATQSLLRDLRTAAAAAAGSGAGMTEDPQARTVAAIQGLAELRDEAAIPMLIESIAESGNSEGVAAAAHQGLVSLCAQDFGRSRRRWQTWARSHLHEPRLEWLLEGLAHKDRSIRGAAAEELRHVSGESFGFDPDAPKRDREPARRRFVSWWRAISPPGGVIARGGHGDRFLEAEDAAPVTAAPKPREP